MDKVHEYIDDNINRPYSSNFNYFMDNEGHVNNVIYHNSRATITFELRYGNKLTVKFEVGRDKSEGQVELPWKWFRFTSRVWRKWKQMTKLLEVVERKKREQDKRNEIEFKRQMFNQCFYVAFPDEINDILLGEDDEDEQDS